MSITWEDRPASQDTNFYLEALAEFHRSNPWKKRSSDVSTKELRQILTRAQQLKEAARVSA